MSRVWVVNASPLILLGKIGHAALLRKLSDELLPDSTSGGTSPDERAPFVPHSGGQIE